MEGDVPKFRKKYEEMSVKLGKLLAKTHLTPNMITVISIFVAMISLPYFYMRDLIMALAIIIIAGILDIFDGALARAIKKTSKFGTLLDNTADRIVEAILILGLTLGNFIPGWLGVLTISSMLLPSYVRARGEAELWVRGMGVGFFERKEKLSTLFAGIILEYIFSNYLKDYQSILVSLIGFNNPFIFISCLIVSAFSLITAVQRLYFYKGVEKEIVESRS